MALSKGRFPTATPHIPAVANEWTTAIARRRGQETCHLARHVAHRARAATSGGGHALVYLYAATSYNTARLQRRPRN